MAGEILTPNAIWHNFKIKNVGIVEVVEELNKDEINVKSSYILGREVNGEQIKIFTISSCTKDCDRKSAIIIPSPLDKPIDLAILEHFAKLGFFVLYVDVYGKKEEGHYTKYPESISYANYEEVKDKLKSVSTDAKSTCYYEWGGVLKYAYYYLKNVEGIKKIGCLGITLGANPVWYLSATEDVDACAFVINGGWLAYNTMHKFSGRKEPQFSDETYKYIAGIEPQSYASHIKCPTFIMGAIGNSKFDSDRIHDTLARIKEGVYAGGDFSVGYSDSISSDGLKNLDVFFQSYLGSRVKKLPETPEIRCEIIDKKLVYTVKTFGKEVEKVNLYIAEEMVAPEKRAYVRLEPVKSKGQEFVFEYIPYHGSLVAIAFSKVVYQSGFELSSNVIAKRFAKDEVLSRISKTKVIYSSAVEGEESIFYSLTSDNCGIDIFNNSKVVVKKGPMDIEGVYSPSGLRTSRIITKKDMPTDGSILMLDIYLPNGGDVEVCITSGKYNTKYFASVSLEKGKIWQNIKIEMNKFKTLEGKILKTYQECSEISFKISEEYLLNNILWT